MSSDANPGAVQNPHAEPVDLKWLRKHKLTTVFFLLFLSIQIAVPIAKLWDPRPARFGWHMWATLPVRREFVLLMRDGSSHPADVTPYVGHARGELDLGNTLPPHLCRMLPDVAEVQVRSNQTTQTHKCP